MKFDFEFMWKGIKLSIKDYLQENHPEDWEMRLNVLVKDTSYLKLAKFLRTARSGSPGESDK